MARSKNRKPLFLRRWPDMEKMEYWRLCDELTAEQAALLLIGVDPADKKAFSIDNEWRTVPPEGFEAILAAVTGAVIQEAVQASIVHAEITRRIEDADGCMAYETITTENPDWGKTKICVESLKRWLSHKGWRNNFFFPDMIEGVPDYLNPDHKFYAPKLAAAVKAWEAVTKSENLLKNKSPKQALDKWLRDHAREFGLTSKHGNPLNEAVEQISKVANWQPQGGAVKIASS
jgi:hypothetical protein